MQWSDKYWDIVSDFYWVPSYLGLKSIPQKEWSVDDDKVTIPREMTNPSGPLYRRSRSGDEYWQYVKRQEETFNHIFDLTLSILPGDVISQILREFLSAQGLHEYELKGKSIRDEYPWIAGANVTTPDSFLVSAASIVAVELKFNARTSLDQLAKYVALIAGEELLNHERQYLDLLFIFPSNGARKFASQTTIDPSQFGSHCFDLLVSSTKNNIVKAFYEEEPDLVRSALNRIKISTISWADLAARLLTCQQALGNSEGDRTLHNLLSGLKSAIVNHPLSQANNPQL